MIRLVSGIGNGGRISDHHDIMVQVSHVLSEGYLPAFNGETIKEQMPLRELLERIFRDSHSVEQEMYRTIKQISTGYDYGSENLSRILHKYDIMYAEAIRRGKIVLPQHKVAWQPTLGGIGNALRGGIDPFNDQRAQMAQKSALDYHRESMLREAAVFAPPSRGILDSGPTHTELLEREEKRLKKKRDDDLFFLTT